MFVAILTAAFPLGGLAGAILSCPMGGSLGRRKTLLIFAIVQILT